MYACASGWDKKCIILCFNVIVSTRWFCFVEKRAKVRKPTFKRDPALISKTTPVKSFAGITPQNDDVKVTIPPPFELNNFSSYSYSIRLSPISVCNDVILASKKIA